MNCTTYLQRFSEYRDGLMPEHRAREMEAHAEGCARCRRYARVVEEGLRILRAGVGPEVSGDFRPRLRHRLYHVDDEMALPGHAHSGATALAIMGIALVLTAVAWSPLLRPTVPTVDLAPIVVSDPPTPLVVRPISAFPFAEPIRPQALYRGGLWDDANSLLMEYSLLSQRYRMETRGSRAGLDRQ